MRKTATAFFALFASAAWGQDVSRVYHFTNINTPGGFECVANTIRTVGDIRDVTVEPSTRTLSTDGNADKMALTDWLFPALDVPASGSAPSPAPYQLPGTDGVVRVFRFAHAGTPAQVQEIVNVARTALEINRIFPCMESSSIAARGSVEQIALAEWLVSQSDVAGPTPGAPTQVRQFPDPRSPEIRVVHLAHTKTALGIQELTNAVRTIADMNRVFPVNTPAILVMRGTADQVAVGEWLLGQLDLAASQQGPAPHEQQVASQWDPVARVFYLSHADTPRALQEIVNAVRATAKVQRVWPCNQPKALAVRGSADQVSQAASLIAQLDK